jgi:hypothetical protein
MKPAGAPFLTQHHDVAAGGVRKPEFIENVRIVPAHICDYKIRHQNSLEYRIRQMSRASDFIRANDEPPSSATHRVTVVYTRSNVDENGMARKQRRIPFALSKILITDAI